MSFDTLLFRCAICRRDIRDWPGLRRRKEMGDVHQIQPRDLIDEMTGPEQRGNAVVIDGRLVPNLTMHDRGAEIEFGLPP